MSEQSPITRLAHSGFDGKSTTASDPESIRLQELLAEPILIANRATGNLDKVYADKEPERFIRWLHLHYRSAYFSASEAKEIE